MTPHKYKPCCRSCEMQPTDVAFLAAHPDEPLQAGMAGLVGSEEQTVKHAPGPLYTTVPEILAHMRDVASRMGNGDYLTARIEEVLAARAIELENIAGENRKLRTALMAVQSLENQQGPPERRIDTPDELLELLAGISSDPQIEGLSLAQKTSSMALLYVAKRLSDLNACFLRNKSSGYTERKRRREHRAAIENQAELAAKALHDIACQLEDINTAIEMIGGTWLAKAAQSPTSPQEPS